MIHETRRRAKIIDTSVYGIATDSFEWVFIRIRPNGEASNLHETSKIVITPLIHFLVDREGLPLGAQCTRDCLDAGKYFRSYCD